MTPESLSDFNTPSAPDWGDVRRRSRSFVLNRYSRFADDADDLAQKVTASIWRQHEAGALRLVHREASLAALIDRAARYACISHYRQLERRRHESIEGDLPDTDDGYDVVEMKMLFGAVEHLPVECPLCVGRRRSCGGGADDPATVRNVVSAALDELLMTRDVRPLRHPRKVEAFLRRVGAESGALAPEAVDKSTQAGTRFTRNLAVCSAHLLFEVLLPARRIPGIVVGAAVSARERCGHDWGTRREAAMAAWADDWQQPWEPR